MQLERDHRNPLAEPKHPEQKAPPKSAGSVIANANKEAQAAWSTLVKERSPSPDPIVIDDEDDADQHIGDAESNKVVDLTNDADSDSIFAGDEEENPRKSNGAESIVAVDYAEPLSPSPKGRTKKLTVRRQTTARRSARTPKRRMSSPTGSKATSDSDLGEKKVKRARRQSRAKATPVVSSSRTLRSRASKTEEQVKQEEEAKARIRNAMAIDDEFTDEDL